MNIMDLEWLKDKLNKIIKNKKISFYEIEIQINESV